LIERILFYFIEEIGKRILFGDQRVSDCLVACRVENWKELQSGKLLVRRKERWKRKKVYLNENIKAKLLHVCPSDLF
jgi:hypothetical protein